jgi:aspartate oxidase
MPTLESRLEKAKKEVEDLKDEFEKSLPKERISTRRSWEGLKFFHKDYPSIVKTHKKLLVAEANLRRLETKIYNKKKDGGRKTRRSTGARKTRRRI